MLESLRENILADADKDDLRVIIISGNFIKYVWDQEGGIHCANPLCLCVLAKGPVFSSGHDLKELTSAEGREYHTKVFHTCAEVCFPLSRCISWYNSKVKRDGATLITYLFWVKKSNVFSLKLNYICEARTKRNSSNRVVVKLTAFILCFFHSIILYLFIYLRRIYL